MAKKFKFGKNINLVLVGILLFAFIFRFYNFSSWIFFGMDQEYEAFLAKNIITGAHYPLIGVNASNTGIYLGPAFIYFAAFVYAFFQGNPLGWAIIASVIGVLVTYLVYFVGKKMFSEKVGIFASLFYASSFLTAFYDRKFWNPMLIPLFSLLIGFLLFQILNKKYKKLIILAAVFGLAIQCHLSIFIFLPLILLIVVKNWKKFSPKVKIWALCIFLFLQLPFIIFEFRHQFLNTKAFFNLLTDKPQQQVVVSSFIERNSMFLSTLGRFFWIPPKPDLFLESGQCSELAWLRKNAYPEGILFVISGVAIFAWWFWDMQKRKKDDKNYSVTNSAKIILWIFFSTLLFTQLYKRVFFEYYFLFFFPWLSMALGRSFDLLWQKQHGRIVVVSIIYLFIFLNFFTLFSSTFSYSYKDKIDAIRFVKQNLNGMDYSLEALGDCSRFGGYRFLFERFSHAPAHSFMDSYFSWLYQSEKAKKLPERVVLLSLIDPRNNGENIAKWEEEKIRFLTENNIEASDRFGQIQIFILSPKTQEE